MTPGSRRSAVRAVAGLLATGAIVLCATGLSGQHPLASQYGESLDRLRRAELELAATLQRADLRSTVGRHAVRDRVRAARLQLLPIDLWLRYLEPVAYDRINGPMAVEWETEVFEPAEKPYRRVGAGLFLLEQALADTSVGRDSLLALVRPSIEALRVFEADSITSQLGSPSTFYLANRLFLLNLAAIYTTGFECPEPAAIVPELRALARGTAETCDAFEREFPGQALTPEYHAAYARLEAFLAAQPDDPAAFDHYAFIRDHVDPLFAMNQGMIRDRGVRSRSTNDYTLVDACPSIFDKSLWTKQNTKGVYSMVDDPQALAQVRAVGKLLFHDPILSGNDSVSCATCHHADRLFAEPGTTRALQLDRTHRVSRNTPSLVSAPDYPLLMQDGRHVTLQAQAHGVITNPLEMGGTEAVVLRKVLGCRDYREAFTRLLRRIPEERTVTMEHVISAITYYYGGFAGALSPFDDAMRGGPPLPANARRGFNLFMGRARCATCHFPPAFSGVKPPFVDLDFEVVGVPEDSTYGTLSPDSGRYGVLPAPETLHAFRTPTLRNVDRTGPYMHNGAFRTLEQVIDFYDRGGGPGHGLVVGNATLPADTLGLTPDERADLLAFLHELDERVPADAPPASLPRSGDPRLNGRTVGGRY